MLVKEWRAATVAEVVPVIGRDYYLAINWLLLQAKSSVEMTIFQGRVSETNKHHRIRKILLTLANVNKNGVPVRIVIYRGTKQDTIGKGNEYFAAAAVKRGVTVRIARPGDFIHSKMIIVDRNFTLLGSHNMTVSGLWDNYEASIMVESATAAEIYRQYFEWLWDRAKDYSLGLAAD